MTVYAVSRNSQSWYGEQIGILILDAAYPCVPGNVGNATTYTYPVRYQEVRGASIDRLLNQRDPALKEAFVEAALELQGRGVKAITGACGFMAYFQEEVAEAVDIPVFLSSLMEIPFMHPVGRGTVGRRNYCQCRAPQSTAFRRQRHSRHDPDRACRNGRSGRVP